MISGAVFLGSEHGEDFHFTSINTMGSMMLRELRYDSLMDLMGSMMLRYDSLMDLGSLPQCVQTRAVRRVVRFFYSFGI